MKRSELRQIIKEEIKKLDEGITFYEKPGGNWTSLSYINFDRLIKQYAPKTYMKYFYKNNEHAGLNGKQGWEYAGPGKIDISVKKLMVAELEKALPTMDEVWVEYVRDEFLPIIKSPKAEQY